jgi:hypothetical protein
VLRVAIIGNGLSIAANGGFELAALTAAVRQRLEAVQIGNESAYEALVRIAANMQADEEHAPGWESDFERLLGPLDRVSRLLNEDLPAIVGGIRPALRPQLAEVSAEVRALYVRGVGAVLGVVDDLVANANIAPVERVVRWLTKGLAAGDRMAVYTVNYDALLDRGLLAVAQELVAAVPRFALADQFSGQPGDVLQFRISAVPGDALLVHVRRAKELPRHRTVDLYHVHGGEQWLRAGDGAVMKAAHLNDVRARHLFTRWANGEAIAAQPVVLLTDQKSRVADLPPFDEDYTRLRRDLFDADRVVITGYSFGDLPLNRTISEVWRHPGRNAAGHWMITRRDCPEEEQDQVIATMRAKLETQDLPEVRFGGLPDVLEAEDDSFD